MDTSLYKEKLISEKTKLESELASVGRRNPNNPRDWEAAAPEEEESDPNDVATNLETFGDNDAILTDLEKRYADVNGALEKINNGTYGKCSVCGNEIEQERLDADPAASTCKAHL